QVPGGGHAADHSRKVTEEQAERSAAAGHRGISGSRLRGTGAGGFPHGSAVRKDLRQRDQHHAGIHLDQHVSQAVGGDWRTVCGVDRPAHPVWVGTSCGEEAEPVQPVGENSFEFQVSSKEPCPSKCDCEVSRGYRGPSTPLPAVTSLRMTVLEGTCDLPLACPLTISQVARLFSCRERCCEGMWGFLSSRTACPRQRELHSPFAGNRDKLLHVQQRGGACA